MAELDATLFMAEPKQLVSVNQSNGKLVLVRDAIELLQRLKKSKKNTTVIGIFGKYRGGKSFLANEIAQRKTGFPVEGSMDAVTQGIWMWLVKHPKREDEYMLLLDSEGLDNPGGDVDRSAKIVMLLIMLSDNLLYNVNGVLDNAALNWINLVGKYVRSGHNIKDLQGIFPKIDFVLRNVTLSMREDSCEKYLENCLNMKEEGNILKQLFQQRQLHTICSPVVTDPLDIDQTENSNFKSEIRRLCEVIYKSEPKVNNEDLVFLIKHLIESFDQNEIPSFHLTCEKMAQHQREATELINLQLEMEQMQRASELTQNRAVLGYVGAGAVVGGVGAVAVGAVASVAVAAVGAVGAVTAAVSGVVGPVLGAAASGVVGLVGMIIFKKENGERERLEGSILIFNSPFRSGIGENSLITQW